MAEYIERNKVLAAIQSRKSPTRSPAQNEMLRTIRVDVNHIPAADVAPVVRAKWKLVGQVCVGGEYVDCYRCGKCSIPYDKKSRFCPNCGADMREG